MGCGWRTGSTLLQRLLCTHPDIHIWGENCGLVRHLHQAAEAVAGFSHVAKQHRRNYQQQQANGWLAMMNPTPDYFHMGLRALLEAYYLDSAIEHGKRRWGFKEVRHEIDIAKFLHQLYPAAKFIFIIRHPARCLASAQATQTAFLKKGLLADVGGAEKFLEHWAAIATSFLCPLDKATMMRIRYEDLVENSFDLVREVGEFLDVDPGEIDRAVFSVRRRGWLEREPRLDDRSREALSADWLWDAARNYGYGPS